MNYHVNIWYADIQYMTTMGAMTHRLRTTALEYGAMRCNFCFNQSCFKEIKKNKILSIYVSFQKSFILHVYASICLLYWAIYNSHNYKYHLKLILCKVLIGPCFQLQIQLNILKMIGCTIKFNTLRFWKVMSVCVWAGRKEAQCRCV